MKCVIGLDYGSDSCRAVIVDAENGNEIASATQHYPRWMKGEYCNAQNNQYRQHPLDYVETLQAVIKEALTKSPPDTAKQVVGLGFDTTASTPILVDKAGIPLSFLPQFADNANAMFVLWKDHTAIKEAMEINKLAKQWKVDYTAYEGGIYSSEWVWAKVLHILREDAAIRAAAYSWVELSDWLPALVTGNTRPETLIRSRCTAGHKAMWHASWGGLPSEEFLTTLDPLLSGYRSRLYTETHACNTCVGNLSPEWATLLGLSPDVVVAVGAIDCHLGAVGAQIKEGSFVRVIGTSTCDIMVVSPQVMKDKLIPGICGQVDGSVIPGFVGLEAGQSAFGDIYAWFKHLLAWPIKHLIASTNLIDESNKEQLINELLDQIIPALSKEAASVSVDESTLIATDWMNGRRTPDANQLLKGTITGLTLGSTAPLIFRALVEATAFGSKAILDRFIENGIEIKEVVGIGGISLKSPFVMQTLSDVLGLPIKVAKSEQVCACGAAMFAAVVAGVYDHIEQAQERMGQGFALEYQPNKYNHERYLELYKKYELIGQFTENSLFI